MAEAGTRDVLVSVKRGAEILRSGYFSLKLSWTLQEAFTFILEHHLPQHVVARKLQGLSLEDVLLYDRNDELLLHRGAEGPGVHGLAHSTVGTVCQQGWHSIRFMTTQDRPPPTPSEVTVTPTALNTWLPPRKNNAIITTPSANLAYNHARASLASFDIGFSPLSASGKAAVHALADVVYYLDHGRGTVASRYHSLTGLGMRRMRRRRRRRRRRSCRAGGRPLPLLRRRWRCRMGRATGRGRTTDLFLGVGFGGGVF